MSSPGTSKAHNSTKCRACCCPEQGAQGLPATLRTVPASPARAPRGRRCPGLPTRAGLSLTTPGRCDSRRPPALPGPPASALTFSHQENPHVLLHGRARCSRPGAAHIGRGGGGGAAAAWATRAPLTERGGRATAAREGPAASGGCAAAARGEAAPQGAGGGGGRAGPERTGR